MHHFIYPNKDTYISSKTPTKNYGLDEILQVGTVNSTQRIWKTTKDFSYSGEIVTFFHPTSFTGQFTGSITGSDSGGQISSSAFSGSLVAFTGYLNGTASGVDTRNIGYWDTTTYQQVERSLLKFDVTEVSKSVANGAIGAPQFRLKLKVCNEDELPLSYKVYALAVSQSWEMGNGTLAAGGSLTGVNWSFRDLNDGANWYLPQLSQSLKRSVDFISTPTLATASFAFGGGTWHTSSNYVASQSFDYQSSDINMDVTALVLAWISGSIANEGILLIHSDELVPTGSGFSLKFFSRETNTIYAPYLDAMWNDVSITTGSIGTSSIDTRTIYAGITASVSSNSTFSLNSGVSGSFSGSMTVIYDANTSASGFIAGIGLDGNVEDVSVFGAITGSVTTDLIRVTSSLGHIIDAYTISASFLDGPFSGSIFNGYYRNNTIESCFLTGSWTTETIVNASASIPLPTQFAPYGYVTVNGKYVGGTALGTYSVSSPTSASFSGQFIDGKTVGGNLFLQLTGSVVTQSYIATSSINITSSVLAPLDIDHPYAITLNNLKPVYRVGDMVRVNVFGRPQFPLKHFGRSLQQEEFLFPKFLPSASFYALKDNETGEIVMGFDSYTQLSCEYPNGNYFVLDTTGLPQERFYRILIRIEDGDDVQTVDAGKVFKIVRGSSWNS
jgi:hypothetical protein